MLVVGESGSKTDLLGIKMHNTPCLSQACIKYVMHINISYILYAYIYEIFKSMYLLYV